MLFNESNAVMAINANGWSLIKTTLLLLQRVHNAVTVTFHPLFKAQLVTTR